MTTEQLAQLAEALETLAGAVRQLADEPAVERERDGLLSVADVAKYYGRSPSTVRTWCEQGAFPNAFLLSGSSWRVPVADLALFDAQQRANGAPATGKVGSPANRKRSDLGAWRDTAPSDAE